MSDPVQMAEAIAGTLRVRGISKPADIEAAMAIPTVVALTRIADAVEDLVEVVRGMAPVSISVERTVDLSVTDEAPDAEPRPYHLREEVVAEVEAMLPISAERVAEGLGITVHSLYRALSRAGRLDLWSKLGREYRP